MTGPERIGYARLRSLICAGILVALYRRTGRIVGLAVDIRNICEPLSPDYVDDADIAIAFQRLADKGYLHDVGETPAVRGPLQLALTDEGLEYVSLRLQDRHSYVWRYYRYGDGWLTSELERAYADIETLPPIRLPADAEVDLDKVRDQIEDATEKIREVIREIRRSNAFAAAPDPEVSGAIEQIETGVRELAAPTLSVSRIESFFFAPLSIIVRKFADVAVADLAETAWRMVKGFVLSALS